MARPSVATVAAVLSSIIRVMTAAGNLQGAVTASASDQCSALARGRRPAISGRSAAAGRY
jgi:hypothetical protein